jgi:hypothetical protein
MLSRLATVFRGLVAGPGGRVALGFALCLALGCASPKVSWDARVGQYSYDQAVGELGPPDNSATLSDGARVADWILSRGGRSGTVSVWRRGGFATYDTGPDWILRLTFGPDGRLKAWKKLAK